MENFSIPLFLLCFLSLHLSSSYAYTLPTAYFISCGSDINISDAGRNFVGDSNYKNALPFTLRGKKSSPITDTTKTSKTLDQTARIFMGKSSYEFKIKTPGIHVVRLHFCASSFPSSALFDVSASGFLLLQNFTLNNTKSPNLIPDFLLFLNIGKLILQFIPHVQSFAFVNAIEVFLAPENLIPAKAPQISSSGRRGNYTGIPSMVLQTIHRIYAGGQNLTPENDILGRFWVPDGEFLYMKNTAIDSYLGQKPQYPEGVDPFIAPDQVYQTSKMMNITNSTDWFSSNFNITWSFNVKKKATHFVRVHFCDIISVSIGVLKFNLYIYDKFEHLILSI